MNLWRTLKQFVLTVLVGLTAVLLAPAAAFAAPAKFQQIAVIDGGNAPFAPTVRTPDGRCISCTRRRLRHPGLTASRPGRSALPESSDRRCRRCPAGSLVYRAW